MIIFWHWWIAAAVLLIVEIVSPGVWFLWLAIAALITGAVTFIWPELIWQVQAGLFGVLSIVAIVFWHNYRKTHPPADQHPTLNRRGNHHIGRQFVLDEPIASGTGRATIDGVPWKIRGTDTVAGTRVTVTGVDGTVLIVEAAGD